MKKLIAALVVAVAFVSSDAWAHASAMCWDRTDKLIVKMKKVDLTTEQLQDVFTYQSEHRAYMRAVHRRGEGCHKHEIAELDFEKKAIGVLNDEQFEELQGRERSEAETLRYENYVLRKEVEALQKQLDELRALLAER